MAGQHKQCRYHNQFWNLVLPFQQGILHFLLLFTVNGSLYETFCDHADNRLLINSHTITNVADEFIFHKTCRILWRILLKVAHCKFASPHHPLVGYTAFSLATNTNVWLQALMNNRHKTKQMNSTTYCRAYIYAHGVFLITMSFILKILKTHQHKQENNRNVDKRKTEPRSIRQNRSGNTYMKSLTLSRNFYCIYKIR
jgi:hypothetical protein